MPGSQLAHSTPLSLAWPAGQASQPVRWAVTSFPPGHSKHSVVSLYRAAPSVKPSTHSVDPYICTGAQPVSQGWQLPPVPARPAAQSTHPTPIESASAPSPQTRHSLALGRL